MKLFRIDEAAERLGFSENFLRLLEDEGQLHAQERVNDVSYYSPAGLDQALQALHCSIQKASWTDMERRMEDVERRVEELSSELKKLKLGNSRVL